MPTKDQNTGIIERIVYGIVMFIAMKAVGKGWIDSDMAAYLSSGAVAAAGGVYAWWINRPKSILQAAASIPGTAVVTTPALAASTPEANIVSNADAKIVPTT